jgi:hypothetical protein
VRDALLVEPRERRVVVADPVDALERLGGLLEELARVGERLERLAGRAVVRRPLERLTQRREALSRWSRSA